MFSSSISTNVLNQVNEKVEVDPIRVPLVLIGSAESTAGSECIGRWRQRKRKNSQRWSGTFLCPKQRKPSCRATAWRAYPSTMPYQIYYLRHWHPITDPIERQIAKAAILRSLRAQYERIRYAYGPPKSLRWVIWCAPDSFVLHLSNTKVTPSGVFHLSGSEDIPHWTLRGFDPRGVARVTYHVFPWGTDAHYEFANGGRHYNGKYLRSSQICRI